MWTLLCVIAGSLLAVAVCGQFYPILNEHDSEIASVRSKRQFPFQSNDFNRNAIFFDNDNIFNDEVQPSARASRPPSIRQTSPRPRQRATTVAIPGMGTPRSSCEDSCLTTSEYNPICGDNGITYMNMARFRCAVQCGQRVQIAAYKACPRTS